MTSRASAEDVLTTIEAGADDDRVEPVSLGVLEIKLLRLLSARS